MVSSSAGLLDLWFGVTHSFDYTISLDRCIKIYCFVNQADLKYCLAAELPYKETRGANGKKLLLFKCFQQRNCVWLHVCQGEYEKM